MGHYRLLQAAYVQRQPGQVPVWDLSNKVAAFRHGSPCELLDAGQTIVSETYPGPYVEALDESGKAAEAEYRKKYPNATLDPTRHLPNGQDPLVMHTFEGLVMRNLEGMLSSATAKPAQNDVLTSIADSQAVLTAAVTEMAKQNAALMHALAQPKHRGGAA
jgi:hypothetical protein